MNLCPQPGHFAGTDMTGSPGASSCEPGASCTGDPVCPSFLPRVSACMFTNTAARDLCAPLSLEKNLASQPCFFSIMEHLSSDLRNKKVTATKSGQHKNLMLTSLAFHATEASIPARIVWLRIVRIAHRRHRGPRHGTASARHRAQNLTANQALLAAQRSYDSPVGILSIAQPAADVAHRSPGG